MTSPSSTEGEDPIQAAAEVTATVWFMARDGYRWLVRHGVTSLFNGSVNMFFGWRCASLAQRVLPPETVGTPFPEPFHHTDYFAVIACGLVVALIGLQAAGRVLWSWIPDTTKQWAGRKLHMRGPAYAECTCPYPDPAVIDMSPMCRRHGGQARA